MKFNRATTISIMLLMIIAGTIKVYGAEIPPEETAQESEKETTDPNTEIIFDADAVKNKTAAKSALADMHGVYVFRNAFIKQEAIVKKAERENRENIENVVLTSIQPELDYQEWVNLVLAADTKKYIKDVYIEEKENNIFLWVYCIIFSICLLCAAIRIEDYFKKNRKDKEKKYEIERLLLCFVSISLFFLTGCSEKSSEKSYAQENDISMQNEDIKVLMELDDNGFFFMKEGNEDSIQTQFYISQGKDIKEIDCCGISAEDIIQCEYEDVNGDGRKDILLTTDEEIWVFCQEETGDYFLWEEDSFTAIKKRV